MSRKIGIVFPGQGSQYPGMGKDLYDAFPEVRDIFAIGNAATGMNLEKICFDVPMETLTETLNCQVALFAAGLSCLTALRKGFIFEPVFAAGHSLGEYTAFASAGAFSVEDGFALVSKRAGFMKAAAGENPGIMAAIIGKTLEDVTVLVSGFAGVYISNINSTGQIVVGGAIASMKGFIAECELSNVRMVPLKVSGAFHTPLMDGASRSLAAEIDKIAVNTPLFPVYTNWNAEPADSPDKVREALKKQVVSPVQWVKTVENFPGRENLAVIELGPKSVLSGLIRKINPSIAVSGVENIETLEKTMELLRR